MKSPDTLFGLGMDERTDGQMDGRTDRQMEGRTGVKQYTPSGAVGV